MKKRLINGLEKIASRLGFNFLENTLLTSKYGFSPDFDRATIDTVATVRPYTMTSPERIYALCEAVKYIVTAGIVGDIVECGVWKGGSMMAVARTLIQLNDYSKNIYLFDTFKGMTEPTEKDVSYQEISALKIFKSQNKTKDLNSVWCYAPLEEVTKNLNSTGSDNNKIHFVKGKVEETIPSQAPPTISLLRLDTDWYESTKHELVHLFPRISTGGVIIIDDYGYWKGARQAVDEYIKENRLKILLNRIDCTGRVGVVFKF